MISIYKNNDLVSTDYGETRGIEIRGLSTDNKPTEIDGKTILNGAVFIEIDTGKIYIFDRENLSWMEI